MIKIKISKFIPILLVLVIFALWLALKMSHSQIADIIIMSSLFVVGFIAYFYFGK